jgi:hypothetical protein
MTTHTTHDIASRIAQATGVNPRYVDVRPNITPGEGEWYVCLYSPLGIRVIERRLQSAGFDTFDAADTDGNQRHVFISERPIDDILSDITERAMEATWDAPPAEPALQVGDTVEAVCDIVSGSVIIATEGAHGTIVATETPFGKPAWVVTFENCTAICFPTSLRRVTTVDSDTALNPEPSEGGECLSDAVLDTMEAPTPTCACCGRRLVGMAVKGSDGSLYCSNYCLVSIEEGDVIGDDAGMPTVWASDHAALQARCEAAEAERDALREGVATARTYGEGTVIGEVIALVECYRDKWDDKDDSYWFMRLSQEVGELGSSLAGDHDDTPEHELRQIASIAMNWLRKRNALLPIAETEAR